MTRRVEVSADARAQARRMGAHGPAIAPRRPAFPPISARPVGSEAAQVWSLGQPGVQGAADVQAGNPGEPVKRRGRKSNGNAEIVSGAPVILSLDLAQNLAGRPGARFGRPSCGTFRWPASVTIPARDSPPGCDAIADLITLHQPKTIVAERFVPPHKQKRARTSAIG